MRATIYEICNALAALSAIAFIAAICIWAGG